MYKRDMEVDGFFECVNLQVLDERRKEEQRLVTGDQYELEGFEFPREKVLHKIRLVIMSKWNYSLKQVSNLEDLSHTGANETHASQRTNANPANSDPVMDRINPVDVRGVHRPTGNQTCSESRVTKAKMDDRRSNVNAAYSAQNEKTLTLLPWKMDGSFTALFTYFNGKEKKSVLDLCTQMNNCTDSEFVLEGHEFPTHAALEQINRVIEQRGWKKPEVSHENSAQDMDRTKPVDAKGVCRPIGNQRDSESVVNKAKGEDCEIIEGSDKLEAFSKQLNIDQASTRDTTVEVSPELNYAGIQPISMRKVNQQQNKSLPVPPVRNKPSTTKTDDCEDPVFKKTKRLSSRLRQTSPPVDDNDDKVRPVTLKEPDDCPSSDREDFYIESKRTTRPKGRDAKTVARKSKPVQKHKLQVERETGSTPTSKGEKTELAPKRLRLGNASTSAKDTDEQRPENVNFRDVYSSSDSDREDVSRELKRKDNLNVGNEKNTTETGERRKLAKKDSLSSPHEDCVEENEAQAINNECDKCGHKQMWILSPGSAPKRASKNGQTSTPSFTCSFVDKNGIKCTYKYSRKDRLNQHFMDEHVTEEEFPCGADGCDKSFKNRDSLRKHRNRKHLT